MILADREIIRLIQEEDMISPVYPATDGISSGVSSYGFDARLGNKLFIFEKTLNEDYVIDPKNINYNDSFFTIHEKEDFFLIPPHGFALGKTKEYYKIPDDIFVLCVGKSTYARCGLIINVTPLEPGWDGYVTLEFSNTTPFPVKLYPNEGVCQFVFFRGNPACDFTYKDKKGKYMSQTDVTLARFKK